MTSVKIGRHTVALTNESRILFPKSKITKGNLIDYYYRIAPVMIPHMKNRPVTMRRFPSGINEEGFYQKDAGDYFPSWIKTKPIKKQSDGIVNYVICNNEATLVYLANQACITPHIWLSKIDKLKYPDRMIFDLDPAKKDFKTVCDVALMIKDVLDYISLSSFVMTTGSKGLHVVVPIKRMYHFDWVRSFARDIARLLVDRHPKLLTLEIRKDKRRGRIFIDTLRNAYAQTGVAPYAVRALEGASIATPLRWEEIIKNKIATAQQFTIKNIFRRISRIGDLWAEINKSAHSLKRARVLLDALLKEQDVD